MPLFCNKIVSRNFLSGSTGVGVQGETGLHGVTGVSFQGETGLYGATGVGFQGVTGLHGVTGVGVQGETGLHGATGAQGTPGPQGETGIGSGGGSQGVTGLQGEPGEPGINGIMGVTGIKGEPGLDGYPGSQGETGVSVYSSISTLVSQISISNTNAETTILTKTLPSNSLAVGSQFKFIFYGTHQNQATSGTLTIRMYIGTNASQTILLATTSTARARTYMEFYGLATVRSEGTNGTYINSGIYQIHTSATATTKSYQGGSSTTVVNTTASTPVVKITAQWQTASTTNTLLVENATIEQIA